MERPTRSNGKHHVKAGGRKKGTPNKVTAKQRQELAASGETPLEYMCRVFRDPKASQDRRDKMASAAAPYMHAKLQSHSGPDGGAISLDIKQLSLDNIDALINRITERLSSIPARNS